MTGLQQLPRCAGVALTVSDVAMASRFYREVLDFQRDGDALRLGNFHLRLRKGIGRPIPPDSRSHDRWFRHLAIVVRDMSAAFQHLVEHGVELISAGPQTLPAWNRDAAGIEAVYFRDPDGHPLELIRFPPGKGKPIWHDAGGSLFKGIDHTAVVVSATSDSLKFYCNILGFRLSATSLNHGVEQQLLSGVADPVVQITSLDGCDECGIELLQYKRPDDGRSQPADTSSEDLWWAETLIEVPDDHRVTSRHRDPDGHGVHLI